MGAPRTTPKVLNALVKRRGQIVTRAELATVTGLSENQVLSAVNSLINREGHPIDVVQRGQMWRLQEERRPAKAAAPRPGTVIRSAPTTATVSDDDTYFERVPGRTGSGDVLVRGDTTDTIYRVVPL